MSIVVAVRKYDCGFLRKNENGEIERVDCSNVEVKALSSMFHFLRYKAAEVEENSASFWEFHGKDYKRGNTGILYSEYGEYYDGPRVCKYTENQVLEILAIAGLIELDDDGYICITPLGFKWDSEYIQGLE